MSGAAGRNYAAGRNVRQIIIEEKQEKRVRDMLARELIRDIFDSSKKHVGKPKTLNH
jgi:hypothetical protein